MSRATKRIDHNLALDDFMIEPVRRILKKCGAPKHWGDPEAVFLFYWVAHPYLADAGFTDSIAYYPFPGKNGTGWPEGNTRNSSPSTG